MVGLGGHTFFWALCGDGELDFIAVGVSSTGKREQHLSILKSTFRPRGEENAGISILELVGRNSPRTRRSYTRKM